MFFITAGPDPALAAQRCIFQHLKFYDKQFSDKLTELQIRGSYEDNSKIIFLIFQQKHML